MTIDELEDFKSSGIEEFWQFAIGEFMIVGPFCLGIERLVTADNISKDTLFWVCVVTFAGCIVTVFGIRQLLRRRAE